MLGRCVAEAILQARDPSDAPKDTERTKMPFPPGGSAFGTPPRKPKEDEAVVFAPEVVALAHEADLFFLNLECCITNHHQRWPNPHKPFFFRAPFCSVNELKILGVDAVTLANNHALDYDVPGLEDTLKTLDEAGIPYTGAGRNLAEARQPVILEHEGMRIGIIGVTDHPLEFDAKADRPGVCYVDLQRRSDIDTPAAAGEGGGGSMGPLVPTWLGDKIRFLKEVEHCDVVIVSPHWGPNMCLDPLLYVRESAKILHNMGADLIAGHSAHCFQGASTELRCLYDIGDFVDDYATDPYARNDLGLFFFVLFDLDTKEPWRVEAVPLKLDFCLTRVAMGQEYDFIVQRFQKFSAKYGTHVWEDKQRRRLVFDL